MKLEERPDDDTGIRRLVEVPREKPTSSCPPPEEWAELVGGLLPHDRSERLLSHAVGCNACGPLLREISEDLSAEAHEEVKEVVASLRTASLRGQRDLAKAMAQRAQKQQRPSTAWIGQIAKAAAVVLLAGAGWLTFNQLQGNQPEQLIAQAYTEQRPFEFRIPEASYAPVRTQRGVGSRLDRPESLLSAEAKIASGLKSNPDDARLLSLRALTELLNRDPEEAIATINRALDQSGNDPSLLATLGLAYALRAEANDRPGDYEAAIEYLGRALKADPRNATALFNRAVVYERMFMYDLATEDWKGFLELNQDQGWDAEARRRMQDIELKKKPAGQASPVSLTIQTNL